MPAGSGNAQNQKKYEHSLVYFATRFIANMDALRIEMLATTATLLILLVLVTAKHDGNLAAWRQDHERRSNPQFACTDNRCVPHRGTHQQEFMLWWLPVGSLRASPQLPEQDSHPAEAWGSVGGPGLTLYSPLHESKHGKVDVCRLCRIRMHLNACINVCIRTYAECTCSC